MEIFHSYVSLPEGIFFRFTISKRVFKTPNLAIRLHRRALQLLKQSHGQLPLLIQAWCDSYDIPPWKLTGKFNFQDSTWFNYDSTMIQPTKWWYIGSTINTIRIPLVIQQFAIGNHQFLEVRYKWAMFHSYVMLHCFSMQGLLVKPTLWKDGSLFQPSNKFKRLFFQAWKWQTLGLNRQTTPPDNAVVYVISSFTSRAWDMSFINCKAQSHLGHANMAVSWGHPPLCEGMKKCWNVS